MSLGASSSSSRSSSQSSSLQMGEDYQLTGSYLDPVQQQQQLAFQGQFADRLMGPGGPGIGQQNQQLRRWTGNDRRRLNAFSGQTDARMRDFRQDYNQGAGALNMFAQQNNPYLQAQIGQLGQNIGQQFREQILPGIGSQATLAGQRGSSRQGVAEGIASRGAMQAFAQGATGLQNNAYNQQLAAAQSLGQMGLAGQQFSGQQTLGAQQLRGQLSNDSFARQASNTFMPFQIGSSVFGAPQALNFGMGYGYDYGQSQSSSKGKGKSAGLDVGFG